MKLSITILISAIACFLTTSIMASEDTYNYKGDCSKLYIKLDPGYHNLWVSTGAGNFDKQQNQTHVDGGSMYLILSGDGSQSGDIDYWLEKPEISYNKSGSIDFWITDTALNNHGEITSCKIHSRVNTVTSHKISTKFSDKKTEDGHHPRLKYYDF